MATTHLHARYTLPPVVADLKRFPAVRLSLVQLLAEEVDSHVAGGHADLGISPNIHEDDSQVIRIPFLQTRRLLIAPRGHELLLIGRPSLRQISRYPQVTYDARLGNTSNLLREFKRAGLSLQTTITAMDSDVMKAYVALGLGVAIIHNVAFNARVDRKLGALDLSYVLKPVTSYLLLRRGKFLAPELQASYWCTSARLDQHSASRPCSLGPDRQRRVTSHLQLVKSTCAVRDKADVWRFLEALKGRFAQFGLLLNEEKTRVLEFGRFAAQHCAQRGLRRPQTFDFLGFTHICGVTRTNGRFTVMRLTSSKRMRATLKALRQTLKRRKHEPIPVVGRWLRRVVQGYFNYHAVPGNRLAAHSIR